MNGYRPVPGWLPALGCASIVAAVSLMCLMPIVLVDAMQGAMQRLHLTPQAAFLAVFGILAGGLFNIPIYRIARHELQPVEILGAYGLWGFSPRWQRVRQDTVIAINVGGCVIPLAIAVWEAMQLSAVGGWPQAATLLIALANIGVCYAVARPVTGIGIMMPGFVSPLTCVMLAWILLGDPQFAELRAPAAFVGGVAGPLIGADLLHLKDITRVSVGMLSIGGAGTFDGIVLSGVVAALFA